MIYFGGLTSLTALLCKGLRQSQAYLIVLEVLEQYKYDVNVQTEGLLALSNVIQDGENGMNNIVHVNSCLCLLRVWCLVHSCCSCKLFRTSFIIFVCVLYSLLSFDLPLSFRIAA